MFDPARFTDMAQYKKKYFDWHILQNFDETVPNFSVDIF